MSAVISPSILNYGFGRLTDELIKASNTDFARMDIVGNHFVPNLTLGLPLAEAAIKSSPVPIDIHLMIEDPDRWVPAYAKLGCESVTFHAEVARTPTHLTREIRVVGRHTGPTLYPATEIEPYLGILGRSDMILIMTVESGFGG